MITEAILYLTSAKQRAIDQVVNMKEKWKLKELAQNMSLTTRVMVNQCTTPNTNKDPTSLKKKKLANPGSKVSDSLQSKKEWYTHVVAKPDLHFNMKTMKYFQDEHGNLIPPGKHCNNNMNCYYYHTSSY